MSDRAGFVPDEPAAGLPVISGGRWFDADGRPFVLRVECPLAFEEMVAALYGTPPPRPSGPPI